MKQQIPARKKPNFGIRTDLAVEARELFAHSNASSETDGIETQEEKTKTYLFTKVRITQEDAAKKLGKPLGSYLTIESPLLRQNDTECRNDVIKLLSQELRTLANLKEHACVLVVGLGNWNITPDALGPKVVKRLLVTRHLQDTLPEELSASVRPVAAISPGVMGLTGIESGEIIQGVVEKMHPDLVIAIDALAARRFHRINAAIQMSDTGICPGAGVGNRRMTLNHDSLGVPVIAIGVPTVVGAATLVHDTMDRLLEELQRHTDQSSPFYEMLRSMNPDEKYDLIEELLTPDGENMFVTPKEVDAVIDHLADIIANAINTALHPGITLEDIQQLAF